VNQPITVKNLKQNVSGNKTVDFLLGFAEQQ